MYCQANIEDCKAEEFDCACGIIACSLHGHVDEGDEGDWEFCPNLVEEGQDLSEFAPIVTHAADPPPIDGLPCHLCHRWGIFPDSVAHGRRK